MLTARDIYTSFSEYKRDIADVTLNNFFYWLNFTLNFVYKRTKGIDPERYIKEKLYTITTTPYSSDLPTDILDINQSSCGLYLMDGANPTTTKLGLSSYGSQKSGFYFTSNKIVFTGQNLNGKSFTMRYIPTIAKIDSLDDYISTDTTNLTPEIVEERHIDYLVKSIDVLYEQWDANPNGESLADFRFVRALGEILDGFKRTPQISSTQDPTQDF